MTRRRIDAMRASVPFLDWLETSRFTTHEPGPRTADLMFGNPQDMPLPRYVAALSQHVVPRDKSWFAYKLNERVAVEVVVKSLGERTGLAWSADDVFMTTGGFAAIAVALQALADPGDEVVFLSPPWFFYELLVLAAGAKPVRVAIGPPAFDLPVEAIARAIGPRTRAVLVNSPQNPTGRVWSKDDFAELGKVLAAASARHGRPIYLLSDEAYAKIVFDGRRAASPSEVYPHTIVLYSYGKQLLAPGQRVGYAALAPSMPLADRERLRKDVVVAQCATGFAFPNALLQHALADIEPLTIDVDVLTRRRDRLVPALRALGYEATMPEGTFYVLVRAPGPAHDDAAFVDALADQSVFVLPGALVELPGWVRLSLTANDAMIDLAIEGFRAVAPR